MADIQQAPEEIVKKFVDFGFKVMFQEIRILTAVFKETMDQQRVSTLSKNLCQLYQGRYGPNLNFSGENRLRWARS